MRAGWSQPQTRALLNPKAMRFCIAIVLLTTSCVGTTAPSSTSPPDDGGTGSDAGGGGADSTTGSDASGTHDSTGTADAGVAADSTGTGDGSGLSGPKCTSTPTQLVNLATLAAETGAGYVTGLPLAVDSTHVYFAYDAALMSVPLGGGPVATLARLPNDLGEAPLVTSGRVVLLDPMATEAGEDYAILSVPVAGGSVLTLATLPTEVSGLGADSQTVYFIDREGTKSVPLGGGPVAVVTTQVTSVSASGAIAVVGGNLIVAMGQQIGDGGAVESIPMDGGSPAAIATGQPNAADPLACGTDVCWWTGPTPFGVAGTSGPGSVARLQADGGITTVPGAPYIPSSFLFDGTDFFETVLLEGLGGPLLRIPASGDPVVTMANEASHVAVDDTCVYYSTISGIYSLVKTYAGSEGDGGVSIDP
jgi:hypothetical protein